MHHRNVSRIAALALLLSAGAAQAQTEDSAQVEEARTNYRAGLQAFQRGRFAEAVLAFERSFHARAHPATLYNAAEARMRAGDTVGALDQLRELVGMTSPAPDAELVSRARTLAQQMNVSDLQPRRVETPTCPTCPTCPSAPTCPPAPPPQRVSRTISPLAYGLAGGSLALIGIGAGFLGVAIDNASTYANAATPRDLQTELRDQGEAYRIIGISTLVLGVGAAVGAAWMFTHPRERSEDAPMARIDFGIGPGGAVLSGRF